MDRNILKGIYVVTHFAAQKAKADLFFLNCVGEGNVYV